MRILRILKARELSAEVQQHITRSTLTVLGNDDLRHSLQVTTILILVDMIILWTMHEEHHIRILLDGSRFTEVTQLRTLTLKTFTGFNTTIQLTEGDDGDIQFLSKTLQRTADG